MRYVATAVRNGRKSRLGMSVSTKELKLLLASPTSRVLRQPPASEQPSAEPERINQPHRCGARTRKQTPCQSSPVRGKTRCRMHGGAAASGATTGYRNDVTNCRSTAGAIAERPGGPGVRVQSHPWA